MVVRVSLSSLKVTCLIILMNITLKICEGQDIDSTLEGWRIAFMQSYTSHKDTTGILKEMENLFPDLVRMYSIGKSVQDRDLWVLQLTQNVNKKRTLLKPMVKIVANLHGNEVLGRSLALMLILDLLKKFKSGDKGIIELLKTTDIHIAPSVNPDGFEIAIPSECGMGGTQKEKDNGGKGRRNANFVDLNRDFPDLFNIQNNKDDQSGLLSGRQPETKNIMKWVWDNPFVLSISLHGGSVVASYPFDDVPPCVEMMPMYKEKQSGVISYTHDHNFFEKLALEYAEYHKTMKTANCSSLKCNTNDESGQDADCVDNNDELFEITYMNGITNGAQWYKVTGGMQDFNYLYSNCFELTVELSCKYPRVSSLSSEWANNEAALYNFIRSVHRGVKGIVKDSKGKLVLHKAKVYTNKIPQASVTTVDGEYWKLLTTKKYHDNQHIIIAEYKGCKASKNVSIVDFSAVILNFKITIKEDCKSHVCKPGPCFKLIVVVLLTALLKYFN